MDLKELKNRFKYHPPSNDDVRENHERIRDACSRVAETFHWYLPVGRETSLAITKIEEAMFWANAAIARSKDNVNDSTVPPSAA